MSAFTLADPAFLGANPPFSPFDIPWTDVFYSENPSDPFVEGTLSTLWLNAITSATKNPTASAAFRPTQKVPGGGALPYLSFNGGNLMVLDAPKFPLNQVFEFMAVWDATTILGRTSSLFVTHNVATGPIWRVDSSGQVVQYAQTQSVSPNGAVTAGLRLLRGQYNAASSFSEVDGTTLSKTGSTGSTNMTALNICNGFLGKLYWLSFINRALTTPEVANFESWSNYHYGTTAV